MNKNSNYKKKNSAKRGRNSNSQSSESTSRGNKHFDKREASDRFQCPENHSYNDISWYNRYPNLLAAASNFPYPYRPGMTLTAGSYKFTSDQTVNFNYNLPGVLILDWSPSVGYARFNTDPISVVGKEIYSRVRSVYSGSLDADAPDYVVYLMALDSIYAYIAYLKRLYRVLTAWSPENYATPDQLLHGMCLSEQEIKRLRIEKVQLWQYINELILQARKFTCPAIMDVIDRHYWLSDNVYTDQPSINSQFYMFNLTYVYQYVPQPDQAGSVPGLSAIKIPNMAARTTGLGAADFFNFGLQLIQALINWDDSYTISGYLKRAYEGTPSFTVAELLQEEPFSPVYDAEVLLQIENSAAVTEGYVATIASTSSAFANVVTQDVATNTIIAEPQFTIDAATLATTDLQYLPVKPIYLNMHSDAPTPQMNVIATRLKASEASMALDSDGNLTFKVQCATEIPLAWRHSRGPTSYETSGLLNVKDCVRQLQLIMYTPSSYDVNELIGLLRLQAFAASPIVAVHIPISTSGEVYLLGDIANLTTISAETLVNLHRICLYSEFNAFS